MIQENMMRQGEKWFLWVALVGMFLVVGGPLTSTGLCYDFSTNAGVDRFAFRTGVPDAPLPPGGNGIPVISFGSADYTAIAASDDSRYGTGVVEGGSVAATRFVFTISEPAPAVTQIDVLWEGGATEGRTQSVWLWNETAGSYVSVGSRVGAPDGTVAGTFTVNPAEFVDAANQVTVMVHLDSGGAELFTDYVSVMITRTAECSIDAECDDGLYCTGVETCDIVAGCQPGTPVDCDDGDPCTIDACNEATDACDNVLTDCNDGLFCNGVESCDPVLGCQSGTPVDCDDAVACTVDACNEATDSCDNVPDHASCSNGTFCDGAETCDPGTGCQAGAPVDCDDTVSCTTDVCNEGTASCDNIPDSSICVTPSVWYVDADATGANDGSSWLNAFNSLQDAFPGARYGDQIWVAAGTYRPDQGAGQTPGDRLATFQLRNGVAVYGHFAGSEATLAERDLTDPSQEVVLSGDLNGDDFSGGSIVENSTHVVTTSGTNATTVLDGFTVTRGNADSVIGYGGGLLNTNGSPTIRNCTFTGNTAGAGGAVYNAVGSPVFVDCTITDNSAGGIGAGMYNLYGTPILIGCTFSLNSTNHNAAGMAEMGGSSEIIDCTFDGNSAGGNGGALHVFTGGVATVTNSLFTANSAGGTGGAIDNNGTALLTNNTVVGNSSSSVGGGMYSVSGAWVDNCIFWGNSDIGGTGETAQITAFFAQVNYSCVPGWSAGGLGGVGNTGADPLLANQGAGDHRLSAGSPCIDAGDDGAVPSAVLTDLDGNQRFFDDPGTIDSGSGTPPIVDMGAYEFGAPPAQPQLELTTAIVGGTPVTVQLVNTYVSPVVVCSAQYDNNTTPVVTRVDNVRAGSFDVYLQNPSDGPVQPEDVQCLVVEEGVWTVDGVRIEAQTYLSTVTDDAGSWVGEARTYGQSYTQPVVLGQVMSTNDPAWSVFWCQGSTRTSPPDASWLRTGKTVGEDTVVTRADEVVGFIVIEAGSGTIGGVAYEAQLGVDTVKAVTESPPYRYQFVAPFAAAPEIAVVTLAGMDGWNGGWAQLDGPTSATATTLFLSLDEDQIGDAERNHTSEQVGYMALAGPLVFP